MTKNIFLLVFISIALLSCNSNKSGEASAKNETIETIMNRKSVRTYLDKGVEKEKIETIIKAGMAAPSGKDARPWELIVLNDKVLIDKLGDSLPYTKMLKQVRNAIVVCGDTAKSPDMWDHDCSAVCENILLAAEALKLGAVWSAMYPFQDRIDLLRHELNLPENIVPLAIIPIGYPSGNQTIKDKYDPSKVHWNKY